MRVRVQVWIALIFVTIVVGGIAAGVAGVAGDSNENITQTDEEVEIDTEWVNINLQAQRTVLEPDETLELSHSAANLHPEDELTVQLILEAPSGADVSGTADIDAGAAGQFVTNTQLSPGGDIEDQTIVIDFLEPGEYELTGQAIYYFGDDTTDGRSAEISIPVEKQAPPPTTTERITGFTTDVVTFVPTTQKSIASDLEERALAGDDQMMIGIYAGGVVAISLVLVVVLSPVIKLLTGRSIARNIRRYPAAMGIGESKVGMFLMLVGFSLFMLDTTALAGSAPVGSVLSAQILAGLIVISPFVLLVSVVILMKARLASTLISIKMGLVKRFRENS